MPGPAIPQWRFSVLGPVRAWRAGSELDPGPPQQRAVLAMLLLRGGAWVELDDLVAGLWGDQPPARAIGTLRTYISRLRRLLSADRSGDLIVTTDGGYRMSVGDTELDLDWFHGLVGKATRAAAESRYADAASGLEKGLGLFGGTALAGLPGPYAAGQRDRLERMRLAAEEEKLVADLELGRYAHVLAELGPLIAAEPLRERLRELQMLALWRIGRPADALAAYQQTRITLAAELGIDPGAGLQQLQQRLLDGHQPTPQGPRGTSHLSVVPAQVPAPPADFTGRAEVLDWATSALLNTDAAPVVGIFGMPGAGKSALAARVAWQVSARFPGGVLYADLDAAGSGSTKTRDVLTAWVRALGYAATDIPTDVTELVGFWRAALTGRRILVVLDGATNCTEAFPLLPNAPGCAALITSNRHLSSLPGSGWHRLGPFTGEESTAYLSRRIGAARITAEPDVVKRLTAARGNLPLSLQTLASRLAARPAWRMADAEQWLEPDDDVAGLYRRLDAIREDLDAGQSRVFAHAATVEHGVTTAAGLAPVLGYTPRDVAAALDELADRSLVTADEPGKYRIDRLIQRYAQLRPMVAPLHLSPAS
nr:BTAD domain-containing putative transcriptional regulator [Actinoplanes lutulentus]